MTAAQQLKASLVEKRRVRLAEGRAILERCKTERRGLNAEETRTYNLAFAEVEDLKGQIDLDRAGDPARRRRPTLTIVDSPKAAPSRCAARIDCPTSSSSAAVRRSRPSRSTSGNSPRPTSPDASTT